MKFKIRNCPNKTLKKKLSNAIMFYSKELMHSSLVRNLFVTLIIDRKMKDSYGECYISGMSDNLKPRRFVIKLNPTDVDPLYSLAHQMIHVKQYAKGELSPCHSKWKATSVNESKTEYVDLPWEKQAYRYDNKLYEQFKNNC